MPELALLGKPLRKLLRIVEKQEIRLIAEYRLTGIDASLLATASLFDIRKVYTIDHGLLKVASSVPGVSVEPPPPPMTLQLDVPSY